VLGDRQQLLSGVNQQQAGLDRLARRRQFTSQQEAAYSMLTSAKLTNAV
jgi:hypothetical protein